MAITDDYDATFHSKAPLSELISEDDRIDLKSVDSRGKTSGGALPDNTVGSSEKPYVRNRTYLATQPTQEGKSPLPFRSELPGIDYTQSESPDHSSEGRPGDALVSVISAPPLLIECDDCMGCGQITHDHPNDPWAKAWTCSMCDGTGEVTAGCECCREDATERFDGLYLCAAHAAEQKADAESVA
jgi:hypothetical protein